jgi:transcriptional regulator with XRE-family HTH domain
MEETSEVVKEPIGDRIKRHLEEKNQKQSWLAEISGHDKSTISRLIAGALAPKRHHLLGIAKAFDISLHDLVHGTSVEGLVDPEDEIQRQSLYDKLATIQTELDTMIQKYEHTKADAQSEQKQRESLEQSLSEMHKIHQKEIELHEITKNELRKNIEKIKIEYEKNQELQLTLDLEIKEHQKTRGILSEIKNKLDIYNSYIIKLESLIVSKDKRITELQKELTSTKNMALGAGIIGVLGTALGYAAGEDNKRKRRG